MCVDIIFASCFCSKIRAGVHSTYAMITTDDQDNAIHRLKLIGIADKIQPSCFKLNDLFFYPIRLKKFFNKFNILLFLQLNFDPLFTLVFQCGMHSTYICLMHLQQWTLIQYLQPSNMRQKVFYVPEKKNSAYFWQLYIFASNLLKASKYRNPLKARAG